jgi:hypothetical protein
MLDCFLLLPLLGFIPLKLLEVGLPLVFLSLPRPRLRLLIRSHRLLPDLRQFLLFLPPYMSLLPIQILKPAPLVQPVFSLPEPVLPGLLHAQPLLCFLPVKLSPGHEPLRNPVLARRCVPVLQVRGHELGGFDGAVVYFVARDEGLVLEHLDQVRGRAGAGGGPGGGAGLEPEFLGPSLVLEDLADQGAGARALDVRGVEGPVLGQGLGRRVREDAALLDLGGGR